MSDFLFSSRRRPPGALRAILERYLAPVTAAWEECHGDWGSLAVARSAHDADPVREDDDFLSVLVGDPVVCAVAGAAGVASAGSRRDLLHARFRAAPAWDGLLDGPFAVLGIEKRSGGGFVVSDLAGFIPIFAAEQRHAAGTDLVLGTHVDCVARAAGRNRALDPVSAADLVINRTCTFPHTLYAGVEQFPPATSRAFAASRGWTDAGAAYWEPVERNPFASLAEAAGAVREGVAEYVRAVCAPHGEVGLLLSGGEDARAVLGAVPREVRVRAFVYADWENREVRVARSAARAYGAQLTFGRRDPDHYLLGFPVVAPLVGSSQHFMDVHGYGLHESLGIRELPVVLGGLSSDAFLKAVHAPAERPGERFRLPPASIVRPELREAVIERRSAFRERLRQLRPRSAAEWERLWPFSMRVHAANLHGNRRLFASHEPFHATAVVRAAAGVPQAWKRHRVLFHRAMRPLLARSWYVPHSRWRYPYFGRFANLPLSAGLRVARGLRAVATGEVRAKQGPWPKWSRVVRSPRAERLWDEIAPEASPLGSIFTATAPDEVRRGVRQEWNAMRELLLLQLCHLAELARRD